METDRVARQIEFLVEMDRLKSVLRQSLITDGSRRENSAEHSWHLALLALVLAEYAEPGLDLQRVIRMVLLHDVVEIDAGDTFAYDLAGQSGRLERELRAAERLFGLLPPDQAEPFAAIWHEFEAGETPGGTLRQCAGPSAAVAAEHAHGGRHVAPAWGHASTR